MAEDKNEIENKIKKIEEEMQLPDFWSDKNKAQELLRELSDLKREKEGLGKYDRGNAILSIISGAGGDDAEDFSKMLLEMYVKYTKKQGWNIFLIHENQNDHGGFRNVTLEIDGKGAYGKLKNENGVHRLVRVSPFNANAKRHTSFSLVEVLPKFSKLDERDFVIPERDLKIEFSRSSGPGGQNVNKRETAVRVIHVPTGIAVHSSGERSQEHNRERAMNMLRAKIFKKAEMDKKTIEESMKKDAGKDIEWGNQIRSYVLHPYKMVKDHRTNSETSNVDRVLDGDIEEFIEAETNL
ncbi:MAG: PCRF domain-containing protein [Candidatus Pacebacteria bacterium]|nr:PCRF domain-containing protein [Candidatus Paceibacterota bacterium]